MNTASVLRADPFGLACAASRRTLRLAAALAVVVGPGAGAAWAEPDDPAADEAGGPPGHAAEVGDSPLDQFEWVREGTGRLGDRAELRIPPGYRFGGSGTAVTLLRSMGNIPDGNELALVGPDDLEWFVIYDFEDIGYVQDDDKDALDADAMLKTFQEGAAASNEERRAQGLDTVEVLGWAIPPRYDERTQVLEWATQLRFTEPDGTSSLSVNYKTKVLGRKGVMNVVVVCSPEELETALPQYRAMMEGFAFVEGERYDQYRPGDRVAEYGLAALVVGGATAVAAKAGLFTALLAFGKKGGKLIVLGLAAVGAFLARLFRRKPR